MLLQWDVIGNREGRNGSQSVFPAKLNSQPEFGQFLHQAWKQGSDGGLRKTNFENSFHKYYRNVPVYVSQSKKHNYKKGCFALFAGEECGMVDGSQQAGMRLWCYANLKQIYHGFTVLQF